MDAIFSIEQIHQVAAALWKEGKSKKIWAFYAEMGSGKTSFIHALCTHLGVSSAISSPSFSIINEYVSPSIGGIYHMDWYRLKDVEEAIQAGVEDALYSGHLCLVEWPEKAISLIPETSFSVHIEVLDAQTRRIFTN